MKKQWKFSTALRHNRRAPRVELSRNATDSHRHYVALCFFQVRRRAAPRAQGPREGALRGPLGALGVIPKPLRMDGHYEWKVISIGTPFRMEGHLNTWDCCRTVPQHV